MSRAAAVTALLLSACVPTGGFDGGWGDPDASFDAGPAAHGWTVSLLAGGGASGLVDGVGAAAQFNMPTGLAIDGQGNLYVADTGNRAIRKVDSTGRVTTLVRAPRLMGPQGVAVDGSGNLYIADTADHCIYQLDRYNALTAFAGTCSLGDAGFQSCGDAWYAAGGRTAADVGSPMGMVVDAAAGMLYVADAYHELVRFSPLGSSFFGSLAGEGDTTAFWDGACGQNYCCGYQYNITECRAAQGSAFRSPTAVALAPNGDVLVADSDNSAVRRINAPGSATACRVSTVAGAATSTQALNGPMGVAAGPGAVVYASDTNNQRVVAIDPSQPPGNRVSTLAGAEALLNPWGLVPGPGGTLYVVDTGHNAIKVLTPPSP